MRILIDHHLPFQLAHGGLQIQIEQTKAALERLKLEVDFVRWWEDGQQGDIIHVFGRPAPLYIQLAQGKGIKVVMSELLTSLGSRPAAHRLLQKTMIKTIRQTLPGFFSDRMGWEAYRLANACVALTPWERHLMIDMFDAPPERVHCVPNGVEEVFLAAPESPRGQWLVCTATITERKRVLELAEAAIAAQTPLWIIGKAYSEASVYACRFLALARSHPQLIRYEGAMADRHQLAAIYRAARGFVLLSSMESLSLSALEAAACGCPLLLSDLPWAKSYFKEHAVYCPAHGGTADCAQALRQFYDVAPNLPCPPKPAGWPAIAEQLRGIYEQILR